MLLRMLFCWVYVKMTDISLHAGKGMSLARVILSYQRRKAKVSSSRVVNDVCSSGYLSDESEDLSLLSVMDSCVNANSDMDSDGKCAPQSPDRLLCGSVQSVLTGSAPFSTGSDGTSNVMTKFPSDIFEESNGQQHISEVRSSGVCLLVLNLFL